MVLRSGSPSIPNNKDAPINCVWIHFLESSRDRILCLHSLNFCIISPYPCHITFFISSSSGIFGVACLCSSINRSTRRNIVRNKTERKKRQQFLFVVEPWAVIINTCLIIIIRSHGDHRWKIVGAYDIVVWSSFLAFLIHLVQKRKRGDLEESPSRHRCSFWILKNEET